MVVERIDIVPFRIPFRRAFQVRDKRFSQCSGLLIRLDDGDGHTGLGEVAARPGCPIPAPDPPLLEAIRNAIAQGVLLHVPAQVRPALESAVLDLRARVAGVPLAALLGTPRRHRVPVNATLDCVDPQQAAEETGLLCERGFSCLKLKVSSFDLAGDLARLAAVRGAAGGRMRLRIDPNATWSVDYAVQAIRCFEQYGLEYVEQPVASIEELAAVRRNVRVRIAADESVTGVAAVEAIAAVGAADVLVVKPSLLGLSVSLDIGRRAAELGLGIVVTSTLDTSVGIAAAAHLAATLPDPLPSCGLATAEWLGGDLVAEPLTARNGYIALPRGDGLGVSLDPRALERWRVHGHESATVGG